MRERMSSKQRVLAAFAHEEPDRVPVDYEANPEVTERLKAHFGLARDDREGLLGALGVDFRRVAAPYVGPKLHDDAPGVKADIWGIRRRWVEHETGGYWDYCDWPLAEATLEQVEAWPMPAGRDFDYSRIPEQCRRHHQLHRHAADHGAGPGGPGHRRPRRPAADRPKK